MDTNKDVYMGKLGCALTNTNELAMEEPVAALTGQRIGTTFFHGRKPIDTIWVMSDVSVSSVCVYPLGYGIGDHHMFSIDITNHSFISADNPPIQWPALCCLTTKSPQTIQQYNNILEHQVTTH